MSDAEPLSTWILRQPGRCRGCGFHPPTQGHREGCTQPGVNPDGVAALPPTAAKRPDPFTEFGDATLLGTPGVAGVPVELRNTVAARGIDNVVLPESPPEVETRPW